MLHLEYRPKDWDEIIGNDALVSSLQSMLNSDSHNHFYLLVGEGGTGKTTVARLIAQHLGIAVIEEINAADSNGVEFARDISSRIQYKAFGQRKMYIVDECQRLTSEAQDVLLKNVLEETPDHAYVVFCTTNPEKIKRTVVSRAAQYHLRKPEQQKLVNYLEHIAEEESIPISMRVLAKIAKTSNRVVRDSLIYLNQVRDLDEEAALSLIEGLTPDEEPEVIEIARSLIKYNMKWNDVASVLKRTSSDPESVVMLLRSYMTKVLLNGENNRAFNALIAVNGYTTGSGMPGLVKACYEAYLRNKEK
jgi:DNA polymerase III subunit gamma/tau